KQTPTPTPNETTQIKEEEKLKLREEITKQLKDEWKKAFYFEIKQTVEGEAQRHYEGKLHNEETEFKNETLRLEAHIKDLKQVLFHFKLFFFLMYTINNKNKTKQNKTMNPNSIEPKQSTITKCSDKWLLLF
ncbi:hypothetical protein RFI_14298, partial [Reticulomyxa filosa]